MLQEKKIPIVAGTTVRSTVREVDRECMHYSLAAKIGKTAGLPWAHSSPKSYAATIILRKTNELCQFGTNQGVIYNLILDSITCCSDPKVSKAIIFFL